MIIEFNKTENTFGVIGGLPYLKNINDWPLNADGKKMLHLFTVFSTIYGGNQFDEKYCISVFVNNGLNENGQAKRGSTTRYAIQQNDNFETAKQHAKVLLLEKSEHPVQVNEDIAVLPVITMSKRHFTNEEVIQEADEEGTDKSKLFATPHFLQDNIHPKPAMKYQPIIQLNEYDLAKIHSQYADIFLGGLAYVWIDQNYRKYTPVKETGYFGIQYL